ncbi:hypothetical protein FOYG_04955 [Fusarium oxysporum NRRL 32931]|uniref:Uncharacterized protein n=1 Tax=Fusarium oxysporum NRRL 32931 TaxID=660029 RepID=W9ITS8_FUSOX|nr:hypothetical protein FOYG_04955 [Fusarium oxysporum NRRL 32931]
MRQPSRLEVREGPARRQNATKRRENIGVKQVSSDRHMYS